MSKRTSRKKPMNTPVFKFDFSDDRVRKILGIVSIFVALYLAISFVSYLYTWKNDQDIVLLHSWEILFQGEVTVSNWLGRLGAIISNTFFYWGFGLPSIFIVSFLVKLGLDLILSNPLKKTWSLFRLSFITMAFSSLLLEFMFRSSEFTWGGAFGESTYIWLSNFLGNLGLLLLLLLSLTIASVWYLNPILSATGMVNIQKRLGLKNIASFFDAFQNATNKGVDSSGSKKSTDAFETTSESGPSNDNRKGSIPTTDSAKNAGEASKDNLEFELPQAFLPKRKPKKGLTPESAELEIEIPPASNVSVSVASETGFDVVTPEAEKAKLLPVQEENKVHIEPYDPKLDLSNYVPPKLEFLNAYSDQKFDIDRSELEANKDQIIETLLNYKIEIVKIRATIGPTVTLYEIVPAPGIKISKIKNLEDDIALSLAALGIRIIAPIPGKGTIGIEVPNKKKSIVSLKEVLNSEKYAEAKMDLPIALGKTISNEVFVADLAKMPHLLIAGATGQGKSVGINTVLMSLLYKKHPSQVKLVLIDPKKVELFPYSNLEKHFLAFMPDQDEPIITDTAKVVTTLNSLCMEMDERYDLLKKARARNIKEYNEKFTSRRLNPENGHKFLPYIVLVIDEFADLIMTAGKEVEMPIARLAQLARAIGIHLIIATQRPSVNIITGIIKANFPARLAFKVTSKIDSRTILDQGGADQLIGRGDMLLSVGSEAIRLQCAFVDTPEVELVIDHIGDQQGFAEPFYLPEFKGEEDLSKDGSNIKVSDLDPMFDEAAKLVVGNQHGSTSMIQRKLQLGYNRAGRIMDQMESLGIVGPAKGSKPREVLFFGETELTQFLEHLRS